MKSRSTILQITILNFKFQNSAHNSKQLFSNFKLRIVITLIRSIFFWRFEKRIAFSEKKPPFEWSHWMPSANFICVRILCIFPKSFHCPPFFIFSWHSLIHNEKKNKCNPCLTLSWTKKNLTNFFKERKIFNNRLKSISKEHWHFYTFAFSRKLKTDQKRNGQC